MPTPMTSEAIRAYYDERYSDKARIGREPKQYRIYLRYLGVKGAEKGNLLDVACGAGLLLQNLSGMKLSLFGIDISRTAIALAKKKVPRASLLVNSGELLCLRDKSFEYILCLGSIEHFLNIPQGLSEMKRVAKPTARFCFVVPNTIHYRLDAKSKWGIKKVTGTKQQEAREQLHTFAEWKALFEKNGLRVRDHYRDLFFEKKNSFTKNALFYIWLRLLPLKYSYQFVFICEKS